MFFSAPRFVVEFFFQSPNSANPIPKLPLNLPPPMSVQAFRRVAVVALYTLREGLKNRVLWIAFVFAIIGVGFAGFIGDVAVTEHKRVETALLAAAYRFCAALVMMIFVVSTVVREFNDKCLELYLSLPISRPVYFFGKLTGFVCSGVVVAAVFAAVMWFYSTPQATAWWFASLACELAVVSALAFFCVLTFNQQIPAAFAAAFFFYILCRATDAILLISKSNIIIPTRGNLFIGEALDRLFLFLPNLGRFTRTEWLVYGDSPAAAMPDILLQTVIFTAVLSAAGLFDLSRKNL